MKKIISLFLAVLMVVSLAVCCIPAASAEPSGSPVGAIKIDPEILGALVAAVSEIRNEGLDLDSSTVSLIAGILTTKAINGTNLSTGTFKNLVKAVAVARTEGIDLDSNALSALVWQISGSESYAEIMVIICKLTGNDPFTDIAKSGFHDEIVEAYYLDLIGGYPDGTFRPKANVSRAQFVTMLWRAAGEPYVIPSISFADSYKIASDFRSAVAWGVKQGIIQGYGDNTFRPNDSISRAQMATFVYRFMKDQGYTFSLIKIVNFTDMPGSSSPYHKPIKAVCADGIMNGVGNNRFNPNGTANRGMAAAVLLRSAKLLTD